MGSSSQKSRTPITDYHVSIYMGISHSFDNLLAIYVGEQLAWEGNLTASGQITINSPEFFGGAKKEGGLIGSVNYLDGSLTQVLPDAIAQKIYGVNGSAAPGYRGVATLLFSNLNGLKSRYWNATQPGFMWSEQNPYLKTVWVKARRNAINTGEGDTANLDGQANPVNIIYECLVNRDWGMAENTFDINTTTFTTSSSTLYDEEMVMSLGWFNQTTIEEFVQEILDHIQATLYVNPRTGLWDIKLLRAPDVDELAAAPHFDETNCIVKNFQRRGSTQMVNELVVTWTNPESEEEETVTVQDLGNITINGGRPISGSRNYYGFRSADLAARAGYRDLRQTTTPLAGCEVLCDRSARFTTPGSIIYLTYAEHELNEIIFRVGEVRYGTKKGDPAVTLVCTEDVFSYAPSNYVTPPATGFVDGDETPIELVQKYPFTAPYFFSQDFTLVVPDEAIVMTFGAQPGSSDTFGFRLLGETVDLGGNPVFEDLGVKSLVGYAESETVWIPEAATDVTDWPTISAAGGNADVGTFVVMGDGTEEEQEIMYIASFVEDSNSGGLGTWTVYRGCLDTIPRDWPIGTPMWFLSSIGSTAFDSTPRAVGAEQVYKFLTKTSLGELAEASAAEVPVTPVVRPHLPNRPANTTVNSADFTSAILDLTSVDPIPVAWANRNRLTEDTVIRQWTDADEPGEVLQETIIVIYDPDTDTRIATIEGLTGTSANLAHSQFPAGYERLFIEFRSQRVDSNSAIEYESLQGLRYHIRLIAEADSNSTSAPVDSNSLTQDSNSTLIQGGFNRRWGYKYGG